MLFSDDEWPGGHNLATNLISGVGSSEVGLAAWLNFDPSHS